MDLYSLLPHVPFNNKVKNKLLENLRLILYGRKPITQDEFRQLSRFRIDINHIDPEEFSETSRVLKGSRETSLNPRLSKAAGLACEILYSHPESPFRGATTNLFHAASFYYRAGMYQEAARLYSKYCEIFTESQVRDGKHKELAGFYHASFKSFFNSEIEEKTRRRKTKTATVAV